MNITQADVAVVKIEIAYLEDALLAARNELDKQRAINDDLRARLEAMTWRALAAEGSNEAHMRQKFERMGE